LKFHSSSPSQVEVHQLIDKQMYHHRLKEHSIGLSLFILMDKNSECNHRWMPSTEKSSKQGRQTDK
jgi:hypothetical protein